MDLVVPLDTICGGRLHGERSLRVEHDLTCMLDFMWLISSHN